MPQEPYAEFWTAIAQIVPVFALALVLEMRRAAPHWHLRNKWPRRIEPLILVAIAFVLSFLFTDSLNALRDRPAMDPRHAEFLIALVLILLVLNPLNLAFMRANSDVAYSLIFKSGISRIIAPLYRRRLHQLEARATAASAKVQETSGLVAALAAEIRADAAKQKLLPGTAVDLLETVVGNAPPDATDISEDITFARAVAAQYDASPSVQLAGRVLHAVLWIVLSMKRICDEQGEEVRKLKVAIAESIEATKGRSLTSSEIQIIEKQIARAGDSLFLP